MRWWSRIASLAVALALWFSSFYLSIFIHELGHWLIFIKYNVSCERLGVGLIKRTDGGYDFGGWCLADANDLRGLSAEEIMALEEEQSRWETTCSTCVIALLCMAINACLVYCAKKSL